MSTEQILIAGIGNIFFGDDAFGVEVARCLLLRSLPDGVRVVDFGIRGLDLAYALLDPYQGVILVDALPRGGQPGTIYVVEPELDEQARPDARAMQPHGLDPWKVLHLVETLGGKVKHLVVLGCEPAPMDMESYPMEMSEPVKVAIEEALPLIESLVSRMKTTGSFLPVPQSV